MKNLYKQLLERLSALESESQTKETSARVSELKRTIALIEFNEEFIPVITDSLERLNDCKCGGKKAEPHTCPYGEEILGSDELCTCCEDCQFQCSQDI